MPITASEAANLASLFKSKELPIFDFSHEALMIKYLQNRTTVLHVAQLAVVLDATFENAYKNAMKLRAEMQERIDSPSNKTFDDLSFIEANPNWRPKFANVNADVASRYKGTVLEMTGNALNRMGINAFNYINRINKEEGDKVAWMCCGEDANGAQLESVLENLANLRDLVGGTATFTSGDKSYKLENPELIPPCSFRPRGLHCIEAHVTRSGEPVVAPFFDLAIWAVIVLPLLLKKKVLPLLYIPKMYLPEEAAIFNHALKLIERLNSIPEGTIKCVFLAETFPAVFKVAAMIEAFEGRTLGVNCGRWDYLFSYVSILANHRNITLPEAGKVNTMLAAKHLVTTAVDLLKYYQIRVAQICHQYGIQFIGGMNATIPSSDPDLQKREAENKKILEKIRNDKIQERKFYGASRTWVAHIGLLEIARDLAKTSFENPANKNIKDIKVTRKHLFNVPEDLPKYTTENFLADAHIVLLYMTMYLLNRNGAVAIHGVMEDVATSEISASLMWYYLKHGIIQKDLVDSSIDSVALFLEQNKLPKNNKNAKMVLQNVTKVVKALLRDLSRRPSLEKALYALATMGDPQETKQENAKAVQALLKTQRFPRNAEVTKLVLQSVTTSPMSKF